MTPSWCAIPSSTDRAGRPVIATGSTAGPGVPTQLRCWTSRDSLAGMKRNGGLLCAISAALAVTSCAAPQVAERGTPEAAPTLEQSYGIPREARRMVPRVADFVLVDKSDRILVLYHRGQAFRAYRGLQFGDAPMGHKRFEGDERTPEGRYTIDTRNPQSSYHLSLRVSYPNASDREYARAYGRSPGGDIFLHGQPNGLASNLRMRGDWTDGCIALSNAEIEEIWELVPDGTPIEIRQ